MENHEMKKLSVRILVMASGVAQLILHAVLLCTLSTIVIDNDETKVQVIIKALFGVIGCFTGSLLFVGALQKLVNMVLLLFLISLLSNIVYIGVYFGLPGTLHLWFMVSTWVISFITWGSCIEYTKSRMSERTSESETNDNVSGETESEKESISKNMSDMAMWEPPMD